LIFFVRRPIRFCLIAFQRRLKIKKPVDSGFFDQNNTAFANGPILVPRLSKAYSTMVHSTVLLTKATLMFISNVLSSFVFIVQE
jgi:hypothetical protein